MGEVKHLKCKSCGKEWDINIGYGMMHANKDFIVRGFSPQVQERAQKALQNEVNPPYGFKMAAASCKKCGEFVSVSTIRNRSAEVTDVCPKCGGLIELAPDNLKGLKCPCCGGDIEVTNSPKRWD